MGKWIENKYSDWQGNVYWLYECTTCHKEEEKENDFCPNCGDKVLTWAMCATDFADYRIK